MCGQTLFREGEPGDSFYICSLLRTEAPNTSRPAEVLRKVNHHLLDLNKAGMFVTALYGVLDRKTRQFTYARAGHHLPILVDAGGDEIAIEQGLGQLLGFFPNPNLDVQSVVIAPGSTLLLYTDGMFDVIDENDHILGENRLREMIRINCGGSAQALCDKIVAELQTYQAGSAQFDDMTLVAITGLAT